jgi:hypothetical protein
MKLEQQPMKLQSSGPAGTSGSQLPNSKQDTFLPQYGQKLVQLVQENLRHLCLMPTFCLLQRIYSITVIVVFTIKRYEF